MRVASRVANVSQEWESQNVSRECESRVELLEQKIRGICNWDPDGSI